MSKRFKLAAQQIVPLIPPLGGCIASDRITVDGARVGMMMRDVTERAQDSGWVFLAGDESQDYLDDAANLAVYDVNTIANYDRAIIPYLYAAPGARFDRKGDGFTEAEDSSPQAAHEKFPVVQGRHAIGTGWSIDLETPFRRRVEDGSLVLWRPCLTIWLIAYEQPRSIAELSSDIAPEAVDVKIANDRLSFRLSEDPKMAPSLNAFVVSSSAYVQLSVYFDREEDAAAAYALLGSVRVSSRAS